MNKQRKTSNFINVFDYDSSNNVTATGSVTAIAFSGSLFGTSSWTQNAISSSYSLSSSFATSASWAPTQTINTGSFATTGSNTFIGNQILSGSLTVSGSITGNLPGSFGASFDGMGSVVLVNSRTFFTAPRAGTITGWNVIADGTFPTFSLDVWRTGSASNSLPTSASSILGGSFVGISGSATNYTSSNNLTAWTSSFAANDIFAINVVSCSVATRINLSLQVIYTT